MDTICGTNEYMAPEMIAGKGYGKSVDWWALGAIMFEMMTGKPPFRSSNRQKLYKKILSEKVSKQNTHILSRSKNAHIQGGRV